MKAIIHVPSVQVDSNEHRMVFALKNAVTERNFTFHVMMVIDSIMMAALLIAKFSRDLLVREDLLKTKIVAGELALLFKECHSS